MTGVRLNHLYEPPGPVCAAFMDARPLPSGGEGAGVKAIMGPVGSGKTTAAMINAVEMAAEQRPSPIDGWKRFKVCIVRATYRQLWGTTIKSWHKRFPKTVGTWNGGKDQPATHELKIKRSETDKILLTVDFVAFGENQSVEDALRGYEPTIFILEEGDTLPDDTLEYCITRAGRYPEKEHGFPTWYGVLAVMNAFDYDHPFYDRFIGDPADGTVLFRQPGAYEKGAENLQNLPPGYYAGQIAAIQKKKPWLVRRMVHNKLGYSRDGKPVYEDYDDDLHCVDILQFDPNRKLVIGVDAGRTPAAVFGQRDDWGRWRILGEKLGVGGATKFGKAISLHVREFYKGAKCEGWGDPAAAHAGDDEHAWLTLLSNASKITFRPAPLPSNDLTTRLEVVREQLRGLSEGRPDLMIAPECKVLRKGFNSGYRYRRMKIANAEIYDDFPQKNDFSHVHDALQYLFLGAGEHLEVMGRGRDRANAGKVHVAEHDFDPLGAW